MSVSTCLKNDRLTSMTVGSDSGSVVSSGDQNFIASEVSFSPVVLVGHVVVTLIRYVIPSYCTDCLKDFFPLMAGVYLLSN